MAENLHPIPPATLELHCLLGQGALTCRYVLMGGAGFECGKHQPDIKRIIDKRVADGKFNARGDNCEGIR